MKNIVIAGGGSAGWLTALYVKKILPDCNVTLVESKEIGILGAGEGSTPALIYLLGFLDIPVSDLIKHCDATIKNGIKFTNWNNDDKFYYHGFGANPEFAIRNIDLDHHSMSTSSALFYNIYKNEDIKEITIGSIASELNKVPFVKHDGSISQGRQQYYPIPSYKDIANFSIHFNASKLADRLKHHGISAGINHIESTIKDVLLSENNNVSGLLIENDSVVKCDFIFDCTGFHRLIIGKTLGSKWKSHSNHLPVDSAMPFFIDMDEKIPPYTEAIAMKYGWVWKIPLQNRYGCGYVYDSSLVSETDIKKEIEMLLGFTPLYPRESKGSFKFSAGYYEETWINNCIAIGLSSGFIEPLEATSIWVSILSLQYILSKPEQMYLNDKRMRDEYNLYFRDMSDQVVDFIYFHYMTNRSDTDFWKKFTFDNAPKGLQETLNKWEYRLPTYSDHSDKKFTAPSWIFVGHGINKINKKIVSYFNEYSHAQKNAVLQYENFKIKQKEISKQFIDHREFLENLKNEL